MGEAVQRGDELREGTETVFVRRKDKSPYVNGSLPNSCQRSWSQVDLANCVQVSRYGFV